MIGARLVRPNLALGREYLELLRETDRVDIGWNEGPQAKAVEHDLDSHIASLNERAYRIGVLRDRTVARVPQANLWLLSAAGHLVGRVGIRYELDDLLTQHGGHIGFAIHPRWRRQGYGRRALQLALRHARRARLDRVLLTCSEHNAGSVRIVESCAGVLQDCVPHPFAPEHVVRRYWIDLAAPSLQHRSDCLIVQPQIEVPDARQAQHQAR